MPRQYRKKASKKGKKAGRKARARMNNMDDHRVVIKTAGSITPLQGLTVSNYVYTYWSPGIGLSIPTGQSQPLASCAEWQLYRNMYDQWRVNRVTVRIIPRANVVDAVGLIAQNDTGSITQGKGVYYTVEDRDGIAPGYIGSLNKYASVKVSRLTSRLTRSYSPTNNKSLWLDCQDQAGLGEVQRTMGMMGGITLYAESLPEVAGTLTNSVWADVEVSYDVTFRGKCLVNIIKNDDGTVTVAPVDEGNMELPFSVNTQEGNQHAGAVDLSGNVIE